MTDLPPLPPTPEDEDAALAAEYVLRLLDPVEEAACAARADREPAFAALVAAWQADFAALDAGFVPVVPPAALRGRIEAALFGRPPSILARLWDSAGFWRAATALALVGLVAVTALGPRVGLLAPPSLEAPRLVSAVQPVGSDVSLLALYEPGAATLEFSRVAGTVQPGRDLQLWLVTPGEPAPASLGLVPASGRFSAPLAPELVARLARGGGEIHVSDEPAGGSPTGLPTGALLASGEIREI